MCFLLVIIFRAIIFFQNIFFKLFISLENNCNKLQIGIRISSIELSRPKLRISTALYIYKTYSKEIHPGVSPFPKQKDFKVFSRVCPAYLCRRSSYMSSLSQKKSFPERIGVCPISIASGQPSSVEELPSKHRCLSCLPQQRSLPVNIGICRAFLSRRAAGKHWCLSSQALASVQPSSTEELPVSIGVCPAFLSRRAWCLSSLPQQKRFPVSIGFCPTFLSKKAPNKHWCLSILPQQKSSW